MRQDNSGEAFDGNRVITRVSSYRNLVGAVFNLGAALSDDSEGRVIIERFDQLQYSLRQYILSADIQYLAQCFSLTELELKLLSLVFVSQSEPGAIGPYMQLSWWEQGPTLSLDRMLYLSNCAGDIKHESLSQLFSDSRLFAWELMQPCNSGEYLMQAYHVVNDIFVYMQGCDEHQVGCANLSIEQAQHRPSIDHCYTRPLSTKADRFNRLIGLRDGERSAFFEEYCFRHNAECCRVIEQDGDKLPASELLKIFRCLTVRSKGEAVYVYWPRLKQYCLDRAIYGEALAQISECSNIYIFFDDITLKDDDGEMLYRLCLPVSANGQDVWLCAPTIDDVGRSWLYYSNALAVGKSSAGMLLSEQEAYQLASYYPLSVSDIHQVFCQVSSEISKHACDGGSHTLYERLQQACLKLSSEASNSYATLSESKVTFRDMTLAGSAQEQLVELVHRLSCQADLEKCVPNFSSGIQALFWGKPGTGKSMAAEAIAGELKLPLYKVNLANIASKWIGETEKHLADLFDTAENQNAILLFDEADAIFSKRSEIESSHDKNANMGVSFLLQRMETYSGLLLLSTNFKSNLDEAFLRRFHSVVEFPMPDETLRTTLWKNVWSKSIVLERGITSESLAAIFEFSPSQISNIAERAILYCLMDKSLVVTKNRLSKSIQRELEKQNSGYLAEQKLQQWLN